MWDLQNLKLGIDGPLFACHITSSISSICFWSLILPLSLRLSVCVVGDGAMIFFFREKGVELTVLNCI